MSDYGSRLKMQPKPKQNKQEPKLVILQPGNWFARLFSRNLRQGIKNVQDKNFTYIWYSFLTKAQLFTLYYQFEFFSIFYIQEMTFLVQNLLLPSKFYKSLQFRSIFTKLC